MSTINGLPAHVLLIHAVVVLIPLLALGAVVATVWPAARRRIGIGLPILGLVCLVLVPITTDAGEWLERHVDEDPLVQRHTELGDGLLIWVLLLFVATVAFWSLDAVQRVGRRSDGPGTQRTPTALDGVARLAAHPAARVVVSVVMVALAVVTVIEVIRIGDSGAKAAWHDSFKP